MINLRKQALKLKEQSEKNLIHNLLKTNQCSPKTYQSKWMDIEKWVTKKKEEIKKCKNDYMNIQ